MVTLKFEQCVNSLYLHNSVKEQIKSSFSKSKVALLGDFLNNSYLEELRKEVGRYKFHEVFAPHQFSYSLADMNENIFLSNDFIELIRYLTGAKKTKGSIVVRMFGKGNFTLLHDNLEKNERLVFFYTLSTKDWKSEWGGQRIFTFGDEREPLIFEPKDNSLAIIKASKGMMEFTKYVKHWAGDNKLARIEGVFGSAPTRN